MLESALLPFGGALGWSMETMDANHNVTNWIGAGASPTTSGWTLQSNTYTIPSGVAYVALYATNWKPTSPAVIRVDDGFLIDNRSSLQITQSLDYLPFGELNSSDSAVTSHKFTGLERDGETGLDHTLFRKYSSTLGRWTTPDPASLSVASPAFPQSWNRYAYVENDPMDWIDPLGLCKNKPCMTGPQCRYPQNWSHCDHEPIALAEYCGITGELCASNNPNAANCTSFGIAVPCGSIGNGFAAISVIDYGKDPDLCIPNPSLCTTIFLIDLGTGGRGGGNSSGGGSTLDDRANALARAVNKTGVQSLGNPCTVAAFYGASALGGAATSGELYAQGAEAATTYWPQALSQVSNWLYRQSLRGGPIANFILNIPKNYNKAKAAVLGGCNAMQ